MEQASFAKPRRGEQPLKGVGDAAWGHRLSPEDVAGDSGKSFLALKSPVTSLADHLAQLKLSIHAKLLFVLLGGVVLLMLMAVLSLVVIQRMSQRVGELTRHQQKVDLAHQMEYAVTAQSHFRGMALLTNDGSYNVKIAKAKVDFSQYLDKLASQSQSADTEFFRQVLEANGRFAASSQKVAALHDAGKIEEAMQVHLDEEHPVSHELEAAMRELVAEAGGQMAQARTAFEADRRYLAIMVGTFSALGLGLALLMGFALSRAFVRPVRQIEAALAGIARGNFSQRIEVPNRDEFGTLSSHVNKMSEELAELYQKLQEELAERQRAESALAGQAQELARSNADLEQFAYVASHDLQEPLRMVSSYTQLLARRYQDRLDDDAREFIVYAVDGATRMQLLIDDLLAYARVGTRGGVYELMDCNAALDRALSNLKSTIEANSASVTRGHLPVVEADPAQIAQLLQNLVGNAIKYRSEETPSVHLSALPGEGSWTFSVRDNGIGIAPEHFERIFVIFQRLHTRSEYPGTGIGLAICKKIVERHGGHIWVESKPGEGSTFYFTLPVKGS